MIKKVFVFMFFSVAIITGVNAQNRLQAQSYIDTLSSEYFFGRGYVHDGHEKAARYIASEMERIGLMPLDKSYLHPFPIQVNTFPDSMVVALKGSELLPGYDYMVSPYSRGLNGKLEIAKLPDSWIKHERRLKRLKRKKFQERALLLPDAENIPIKEILYHYKGNLLIEPQKKLTWSVASGNVNKAWIWVQKDSCFMQEGDTIQVNMSNQLNKITSFNVAGMIPGMQFPDSVVVLCGHYDHLGGMGLNTWFPGANDNASGIAMMLDLAAWFKENPQPYTIVFVAFGGEEAGLIGSRYFVEHPPAYLQLNQIKFLMNMDLMGSGEKGATIVNATVFPNQFAMLSGLNEMHHYLPKINQRGKAANSDHYYYSEAGVPSFFMYLMGDFNYYHEPLDNANELTLGPYYDRTFNLLRDFIPALMR